MIFFQYNNVRYKCKEFSKMKTFSNLLFSFFHIFQYSLLILIFHYFLLFFSYCFEDKIGKIHIIDAFFIDFDR